MREANIKKRRTLECFCTGARKVEPVGGDCVRIYLSIERNGVWEDKVEIVMPIASVLSSSKFVVEATTEIFNESQLGFESVETKIRH
jgi:hypothetical protein